MIVRSIKIIIIFPIFYIYAQTESEPVNNFNYQLSSERYFSNEDGQIMMKVNVWGHVQKPGPYLVFEDIDLIIKSFNKVWKNIDQLK